MLLLVCDIICTAELINVGWGKKSTQFHGSEGKPKTEQLKEKVCQFPRMV